MTAGGYELKFAGLVDGNYEEKNGKKKESCKKAACPKNGRTGKKQGQINCTVLR